MALGVHNYHNQNHASVGSRYLQKKSTTSAPNGVTNDLSSSQTNGASPSRNIFANLERKASNTRNAGAFSIGLDVGSKLASKKVPRITANMKRMSQLTVAGDGISRVILFSEEDFEGERLALIESDPNVAKNKQWQHQIKSIVCQGNPWIVYPELQYKGIPTFVEEGRYKDTSAFPVLDKCLSIKFIPDDLGSPELRLFSMSGFTGDCPWQKVDGKGDTFKYISVGDAGIWACRSKDDTIWIRKGENFEKIEGGLRLISVGSNSVWGVNSNNVVMARIGISADTPTGREWATVDGEPMRQVAVSNKGHVWGVDMNEKIWHRRGACNETVLGSGWKMLPGNLKQISVGECGVWGTNSDQQVWYRLNTAGDPEGEGTGWLRIEGRFQQVYSGNDCVLALAGNRDLYYRANLSETTNREGTNWVRLGQDKDKKIIFKQFEFAQRTLWGIDIKNQVWFKEELEDDIMSNYEVKAYGDESEFSRYNFPAKAITCKAPSGGWVIYSEPNFQGKHLYQIGSDCISNDPPTEGSPYKTWFTQVGSARPIRGQNYRTPILKITMDWSKMDVLPSQEVLFEKVIKNETEDYMDAPWEPTFEVETTARHNFALKQAQNLSSGGASVVRGCEFKVNNVDPIEFEVNNCPPLFTGEDYHSTLDSTFTFKDDISSARASKKTLTVTLPPLVPPRCTFTAKIAINRCKVKVPFKADFKIGFGPNFDQGSESWFESGIYEGTDESNVKIELTSERMPTQRKVSKMINGLGEDM